MSRTAVIVSVDTESTMGGAWADPARKPVPADRHVFCETPDGPLGLPLICDELERRRLRATFFVETLAGLVLGRDDTQRVVDHLLGRGHDVQLHAHPTFRHYRDHLARVAAGTAEDDPWECDQFSGHDIETQRDLMRDALNEFTAVVGRRPVAFRAGGFAANHDTLRVVAENGIAIDASYNPLYRIANRSFPDDPPETNRVQRLGGVWEVPVTVARSRIPEGVGLKHLDLTAISAGEIARALDQSHAAGTPLVVTIFHCFSLVKPRDVTYRELRPNRVVIARLRRFLDHLARHEDRFEVLTFGELAGRPDLLRESAPSALPDLGLLRPAVRKLVQAANNLYWV